MGRNQFLNGLLVAGCCCLAVGCDSSEKPKPVDPAETTGSDGTNAADPKAAAPAKTNSDLQNQPVSVTMVTPAELSQEIQKRKGQVVLVDFWATWCIPCIQNFPHSVDWQQEYGDQGLAVISVSMDAPDPDTHQSVLEFLKKQNAHFTNFHSSLGGEEEAMLGFDVKGGSLPHYKIYDKTGNLVQTFGGEPETPEPEDIEAAIKSALGVE